MQPDQDQPDRRRPLPEEAALLAALASGDWDGLLALCEGMVAMLVRQHAFPLPPSQGPEDAMQTARLVVIEAARKWRPDGGMALRTWLWGCVARRLLSWRGYGWRRLSARPFALVVGLDEPVTATDGAVLAEIVPDPDADPDLWRDRIDDEATLASLRARWRLLVRRMTPHQRRLAQAWLEADGSLVEVAAACGVSRKAADNAAQAVRRVLKGGCRHANPYKASLRGRWDRFWRHGRQRINRTNSLSAPRNKSARKCMEQAGKRDAVSE